jgi:hypothetical protein
MPLSDPLLWDKIATWTLPHRRERDDFAEPPRTCGSFEDCLRKKGDWTDASASRITEMYRKFLYLKALSGKPVTPSEAIDMAWHLHLEFPADYSALCDAVGRDIPHRIVFYENELEEAYVRGRALYEAEFDAPPDRDLWPSGEDQTRAEIYRLVVMGAVLVGVVSVLLGSAVGGLAGLLLAGAIVAAAISVVFYLHARWGDASPSKMARCA